MAEPGSFAPSELRSSFALYPGLTPRAMLFSPLRGSIRALRFQARLISTLRHNREVGEDGFNVSLRATTTQVRVRETSLCLCREAASPEETALHVEV
jgi:hypothetical protein